VALGQAVYLWHADTGAVNLLVDFEADNRVPTLVKWSQEGRFLSIGFSDGLLKIFDISREVCVREISVQMQRMATGCWTRKGIFSYGTKSGQIYHHDVRSAQSLIGLFNSHSHEVCGVKWSPDERYMTSGGADALVNVFEHSQIGTTNPCTLYSFNEHTAPVKAIEYIPFMGFGANMVATGGGANDHTVRIWNLSSGTRHSSFDASSQIVSIVCNKTYSEMITGHGNPHPGVRVWRRDPSGNKFEHVADFKEHGGRILGLCQSPNKQCVMSTGDDETMRIWHCWKETNPLPRPPPFVHAIR